MCIYIYVYTYPYTYAHMYIRSLSVHHSAKHRQQYGQRGPQPQQQELSQKAPGSFGSQALPWGSGRIGAVGAHGRFDHVGVV